MILLLDSFDDRETTQVHGGFGIVLYLKDSYNYVSSYNPNKLKV